MKRLFSILLLFVMSGSMALADVLPEGMEVVEQCPIIANMDEFPDYYFLSVVESPMEDKFTSEIIEEGQCSFSFARYLTGKQSAVLKSDFPEADFSSINSFDDERLIPFSVDLPTGSRFAEKPNDIEKTKMVFTIESIDDEVSIYKSQEGYFYKDGYSTVSFFTPEGFMTNEGPDPMPVEPNPFNDVSSNHPFHRPIAVLKFDGVVEGYSDGSYKPESSINRAEFTKIVVAAELNYDPDQDPSGLDIYASVGLSFWDVEDHAWYIPYLRKAVQNGIIGGYPDGTFKPGNNINFAEAYKIVLTTIYPDYPFDEEKYDNWYETYLNYAYQNKLNIYEKIDPAKEVTRGEMAGVILKAHNL